jgi:hypothetical protein
MEISTRFRGVVPTLPVSLPAGIEFWVTDDAPEIPATRDHVEVEASVRTPIVTPAAVDSRQEHGRVERVFRRSAIRPDGAAARHYSLGPPHSGWTDTELTDAALLLCDELPATRMLACWRAVEYCRRTTPRGTPESLLDGMRTALREKLEINRSYLAAA